MKTRNGFISNSSSSSFLISAKVNGDDNPIERYDNDLMHLYKIKDKHYITVQLYKALTDELNVLWYKAKNTRVINKEDVKKKDWYIYLRGEDDFDNFIEKAFKLGHEIRLIEAADKGDGGNNLTAAIRDLDQNFNLDTDILMIKEIYC